MHCCHEWFFPQSHVSPPLYSSSLGRGAPLIVPVPLPCFFSHPRQVTFHSFLTIFFTCHAFPGRNMAISPMEILTPHSTSFKVLVACTIHAFFQSQKIVLKQQPKIRQYSLKLIKIVPMSRYFVWKSELVVILKPKFGNIINIKQSFTTFKPR